MLRSFFTIVLGVLSSGLVAQTNYYVSTAGNNSNSGTSINQAWKTIQYGLDQLNPNSIMHILEGSYNEKVYINVSGNSTQPIIIKNYNEDEVLIDGSNLPGDDAIIGIYDQSYIHIEGLIIANNSQLDAQGIIVEGNCQGIEIRNNVIYNINFSTDPNLAANANRNAQPLIVYGSNPNFSIQDLIIENNVIHDSRTGFSEGLAVNGNVDGFIVSNNKLFNISNIGIDIIGHEGTASSNDQARNGLIKNNVVRNCKSPYATAAGIYVDGGKDLIIESNQVSDCQWGIEVGCENVSKTTSNIIVRSNLIYNNDDAGITIGGFDFPSGSGKVVDSQILNNTLYNNDVLLTGVGGETGEVNISYTENCILENNIFHGKTTAELLLFVDNVGSINLNLDYNLYYGSTNAEYQYNGASYSSFSGYVTGSTQDPHSSFEDPLFRFVSFGDLHLASNSPARDMGNPSNSVQHGTEDYNTDTRVQNARIDIGADEYTPCINVITLTGDLFSNSYSTLQEITMEAQINKGSESNLITPEVYFNYPFAVASNGVLAVHSEACK